MCGRAAKVSNVKKDRKREEAEPSGGREGASMRELLTW
jgi:hypothetical protein